MPIISNSTTAQTNLRIENLSLSLSQLTLIYVSVPLLDDSPSAKRLQVGSPPLLSVLPAMLFGTSLGLCLTLVQHGPAAADDIGSDLGNTGRNHLVDFRGNPMTLAQL